MHSLHRISKKQTAHAGGEDGASVALHTEATIQLVPVLKQTMDKWLSRSEYGPALFAHVSTD
jgi:hypothetical protein